MHRYLADPMKVTAKNSQFSPYYTYYQGREAIQSILEFETCLRTCTGLGPKSSPGPNNTFTANAAGSRCDHDHDQTACPGCLTSPTWVQLDSLSGFDGKLRFHGKGMDWESLVADPLV